MGDYLSSLVARNIGPASLQEGPAAVMQPRPRSRFEPSPFSGQPDSYDPSAQVEDARAPESDLPRAAPSGAPHRGRLDAHQPAQPSLSFDFNQERAGDSKSQNVVPSKAPSTYTAGGALRMHPELHPEDIENQKIQPDLASPAPSPASLPGESGAEYPQRAAGSRSPRTRPRTASPAGLQDLSAESIQVAPSVPDSTLPASASPERDRKALTPLQTPSPDPGFTEVSETRRAVQVEPQPLEPSSSRQDPPRPQSSADLRPALPPMPDLHARAAPDPGPTIQVSIGRIEVRATSEPAPPPSRSAPRPLVMSLEEYLKIRSNGDAR